MHVDVYDRLKAGQPQALTGVSVPDGIPVVTICAAGLFADTLGLRWAIGAVGSFTLCSGIIVAFVMYETLPARRAQREGAR